MPTPTLIPVFSHHRHPRLRYVLKELGRDLGYDFRLILDASKWEEVEAAGKISLSENIRGVKCLQLPAHPLLSGRSVEKSDLEVNDSGRVPSFFMVQGKPDHLACCFYVLSRYEEYQPFDADAHGRFPASASHARKHGYLHRPVVREWAALIANQLRKVFPDLPAPREHHWRFRPSYDIDLPWAYRHRGLRGAAAGVRDLLTGHPRRAWDRLTASSKTDPYHRDLAFIRSLHLPPGPEDLALEPVWFWLLADGADKKDPNPYPVPDEQQALIKELALTDTTGIHPGYRTSDDTDALRKEIARLAQITGVGVRHSRQHFLRFRLPDTYRELRTAGIIHDYTMGYADDVGWRAGTNLPFSWYDLEREEATGLMVHSFAAMDVTLKNYLGLGPEAAVRRVTELADAVRPFGGAFMLLWHNSSFAEAYGWAGWREAYVRIVNGLRR